MKSPMKYLMIVILILTITSCSKSQTSGTKTKDIDIYVGLKGLTMEFLKNTPPQKVFEHSEFPVIINIKNTGAYSIKGDKEYNKAILSLGVEKDYTKSLRLLPSGNVKSLNTDTADTANIATFSLEGRSQINQKGGEEVISYALAAGQIDPQSEFHSSTITATLCYPYETILSATICIDTDISGIRTGKKVCKLQDLSFNNGQGAPVTIPKIEVQILPSQESQQSPEGYGTVKPQFLIFIENKGEGIVIKNDAITDFCTKGNINHEKFNILFIRGFLGGEELNCNKEKISDQKQGLVKLKDKKELARCTLENGIDSKQDSYLSPLRIELTYGYTQSISVNYFIQKTAR